MDDNLKSILSTSLRFLVHFSRPKVDPSLMTWSRRARFISAAAPNEYLESMWNNTELSRKRQKNILGQLGLEKWDIFFGDLKLDRRGIILQNKGKNWTIFYRFFHVVTLVQRGAFWSHTYLLLLGQFLYGTCWAARNPWLMERTDSFVRPHKSCCLRELNGEKIYVMKSSYFPPTRSLSVFFQYIVMSSHLSRIRQVSHWKKASIIWRSLPGKCACQTFSCSL